MWQLTIGKNGVVAENRLTKETKQFDSMIEALFALFSFKYYVAEVRNNCYIILEV